MNTTTDLPFDTLYEQTGEYAGHACSEPNPFNPTHTTTWWVPIEGGEVMADVCIGDPNDPDTWGESDYRPTGIVLSAEQVADLLWPAE